MNRDERNRRREPRPPEGEASAQVAEQIAAKKSLFGDAGLRKKPRQEPEARRIVGHLRT